MKRLRAWVPGLLSGLLAACATTPITVAPTSIPLMPSHGGPVDAAVPMPSSAPPASSPQAGRLVNDGPQCAVRLADVLDVRPNANDLGMMGMRAVHAADSVAWLKSALAALNQDRRLHIVDTDAEAQLVLRVELVKAYILTQNTQKSSNVVLRATFSRDGKEFDTQIARGRDEGANWAGGEEETQGSLNRAMVAAVWELDSAIAARCAVPGKTSN